MFDTKQGYWQKRKREWKEIGLQSETGRDTALLGNGLKSLDNGLCLYNEMILLNQYGTAPLRAGLLFEAKRKTVKVHQNVLVFYKGDIEKIKDIYSNEFVKLDLSKI